MATNKKQFRANIRFGAKACLPVFLILWVAGCSPTGPGALLRGKRLLEKGDYAGAVSQLERAATLLSTNAQVWNYLGVAYHKAGQGANAQESYQRALKLNPDLVIVHYNLGCLLLEENRPDSLEAAQNEFTAFVLRQSGSADGWIKLGTAQLRLARLPAAEASYREALKISPQNAEALNDLGVVQLERRRFRDAAAFFGGALRQQPNCAPAILNLAITDFYQNNHPQALEHYQEYLALNPRPANWDAVAAAASQLERELSPASGTTGGENRSAPPTANPRGIATTGESSRPENSNAASRNAAPRIDSVGRTEAVRLAEASASKPGTADNSPAAQPIVSGADSGKPPRRGFLQKINPLNLFDRPSTPETKAAPPPQVVTVPADSDEVIVTPTAPIAPPRPRPPVAVARYPYLKGGKPADGRRADAEFYLGKGREAQRDSRLKDAVGFYRSAAQTDPGYFDAQMALATAAYEIGDAADMALALRSYETAVAIDPDSFKARYGFGLALKKANYIRDAAEQLETLAGSHSAAETPGQLAAVHLTLGNLYADQFHQTADARAHYQKVLQLDPENPQATAIRYWLQDNPP